ncbi:cell wall protein dan4-like isoform x3 [Limosa lapponica baueri]|uniref:Cell wall protein dan4-like isoform x3 n=1 Tax=Limosa lapponica baueri TaxID=1758121 RepID=A0A2I0TNS3_LIMLA|nr:cell wall protein dan4-like isoform x3 [Limosa lapponica baueri]
MIQFSWKPEGGTRDGPYRVRLWGGSREVQNRSLYETSIAFENLLSDNEYQISVDVSTCSKNVSTSLTVRTAAEVFNGTTRITNNVFIPEYQNKSSTAFKDFETKFIKEIEKHLPQRILELIKGEKMRIVINSIRNGSVIVHFNIVLDVGENITKPEISDAFTDALNMSTVLQADLTKTVIEDYQTFACSVLLKSQTFNHTLYNSDSEGYKTTSESIKTEVVREMRIKLKDDHFDIIMLGFRPGSVIAYFISLLQNQEPIDVTIIQAHLNQILKSKFGDQTEVTVKSLTAQSSTGKSSSWKVAVIVLGVLLGVALVLILLVSLVYIYMKKRSVDTVNGVTAIGSRSPVRTAQSGVILLGFMHLAKGDSPHLRFLSPYEDASFSPVTAE